MRVKQSLTVMLCFALSGLLVAAGAVADDVQEVARDMGAVLAWRLGPEAFEQHCRDIDPAGAEQRRKALDTWLEKNARLIASVDERVAAVIPLVRPPRNGEDVVHAVRAQVQAMLRQEFSAGRNAEESQAICKLESDPARPRWTSNGLPQVQNSLAALYDWQVARNAKSP
jgi:hypothetical protein